MPYYKKPIYAKKHNYRGKRLQKRWYFDATIGKNVPIIGGTGLRMGSGPLQKRSLNALVKQAVTATLPQKHKVIDAVTAAKYAHQTNYTFNPLGNIPVGTGEQQRLATEIRVKYIKLRICLQNDTTLGAPAQNFPKQVRILWVRSDEQVMGGLDTFGSGLGNSALWQPGFSLPFNAFIDSDRCTVLADKIVKLPNPTIADAATLLQQTSVVFDFDCPIPAGGIPFKYDGLTTNYSSVNKNLYCVMIPYMPDGTTGLNVLQMQHSADICFTDGA